MVFSLTGEVRFKRVWDTLARRKTPEQVVLGSWLAPRYSSEVGEKDFEGVETMLMVNRDHLILDVGCGAMARSLTFFGKKGFRIVGVDISSAAVGKARESVCRVRICENVDFVVGDAEFLPFRAGMFDRVLAISVLAHLSSRASVRGALKEVFRCLRKRGLSYLSWWLNMYSPWSQMLVFANRLGFAGEAERIQLLTFKGSREVCEVCSRSGLTVTRMTAGSVLWYLYHILPKGFCPGIQKLSKALGNLQGQRRKLTLPPFHYDIVARKG